MFIYRKLKIKSNFVFFMINTLALFARTTSTIGTWEINERRPSMVQKRFILAAWLGSLFLFYFCNWSRVSRARLREARRSANGASTVVHTLGSGSHRHQYTTGAVSASRDHWSTICRPIIETLQTKISNVSPQIIKHILCMIRGLNRQNTIC